MWHVLMIKDEPLAAMDIQGILAFEGATSFEIVDTEDASARSATNHKPRSD